MENQELAKKLASPSKNSRLETFGRTITFLCLALIVFIVAMILIFVAQKGCQPSLLTRLIFLISCLERSGNQV